jgi:hypothetical protein
MDRFIQSCAASRGTDIAFSIPVCHKFSVIHDNPLPAGIISASVVAWAHPLFHIRHGPYLRVLFPWWPLKGFCDVFREVSMIDFDMEKFPLSVLFPFA